MKEPPRTGWLPRLRLPDCPGALIRQIATDIETFSPAPLAKTSVYPYAEHPDFRLLIFGYSIDSGPVEVVDLASGGGLPDGGARSIGGPGRGQVGA